MDDLAIDLANFIHALHAIDIKNGPLPDIENFAHIDGLEFYEHEVYKSISLLKNTIEENLIMKIWEKGKNTKWQNKAVWVHGDISSGNILVKNGKLNAVIDFEGIAIGDPACDLVIAYKFFSPQTRKIFREHLNLDDDTWMRARSWALWKALILSAKLYESNEIEQNWAWNVINQVIDDFNDNGK